MEAANDWRSGSSTPKRTPMAIAIRRDINVGESAAEAEKTARAVVDRGYRGIEPSALVWGDVATVAEKFRRLGAMGYTDVIVRHLVDDQAKIIGSLARLAEVRRAVAPRRASPPGGHERPSHPHARGAEDPAPHPRQHHAD